MGIQADDPDDSIDIEMRSTADVANRFIILSAILRRLIVDADTAAAGLEQSLTMAFDLREWLRGEGLWDALTADEARYLTSTPGDEIPDAVTDVRMMAEAMVTVSWAMALTESLTDGEPCDPAAILEQVPVPWDKIAPWTSRRALRPDPEIIAVRERTELWEWRFGLEEVRRDLTGDELEELEGVIVNVYQEGELAGLFSPGKDSAFSVNSAPISAMKPDEVDDLLSITRFRLRALNWVCGFGEDWSNVPIDV